MSPFAQPHAQRSSRPMGAIDNIGGLMASLAGTLLAGAALAACAPPRPAAPAAPAQAESVPSRYRCDDASEFTVRLAEDAAALDGVRGNEQLLRDAGGLKPQHSVYGNSRLRAEFGLGDRGDQALLHDLATRKQIRCARVSPR